MGRVAKFACPRVLDDQKMKEDNQKLILVVLLTTTFSWGHYLVRQRVVSSIICTSIEKIQLHDPLIFILIIKVLHITFSEYFKCSHDSKSFQSFL